MLPGGSSCFVVVTSRHALSGLTAGEGAHRLDIGRMTDDDARALLCARVREASLAHEPVARLIERCARLPLALRVAADRLREPSSRDIAGLVAELEVEQDRLDLLETGDDHTSVRAVLSWSYRQLAPEAARLFRLCGFRCPHTRHYLDVHGAAALLGTADVRLARRLLGELVRCGLLEEAGGGRYQMHELLQAYAAELAEETEASIAAQQRLLGQYLNTAYRPRRSSGDGRARCSPTALQARAHWNCPVARAPCSGWIPSGRTCSVQRSSPPRTASPPTPSTCRPRCGRTSISAGTWTSPGGYIPSRGRRRTSSATARPKASWSARWGFTNSGWSDTTRPRACCGKLSHSTPPTVTARSAIPR